MISDEKIMAKVKKGKTELVSVLFDRYCDYLYNYFLNLCKCQQASEDLTQNVFIRIIKYNYSYNENRLFKSWMFQIARNQFYNYSEKLKKEAEIHSNIKNSASIVQDEILDNLEEYKVLESALNLLKIETKELIVLAKYQNFRYKELADTFNTSEGAIKVKVHRGINELRKKYFEILNN